MRQLDLDAVTATHVACVRERLRLRLACRRLAPADHAAAMYAQSERERVAFQCLASLELADLEALTRALHWWAAEHEQAYLPAVNEAMAHLDEAAGYLGQAREDLVEARQAA